ncbi:MAG TPA: DUF6773 family protein [Clostridia bacterium]|nr:DUF6773 family protein [Clostridia bacterium]
MSKNVLDEMQLQRRNRFGNQSFMLMFYLLMADIGLYGFGFRWLKYPLNVFTIMLICMTYYLVRVILGNAYVGPQSREKHKIRMVLYPAAIAVLAAAAVVLISQKGFVMAQTQGDSDKGAMILFTVSVVFFTIALIVGVIAKRQNIEDEE